MMPFARVRPAGRGFGGRRRVRAPVVGALVALLLLAGAPGCGKYGPPERSGGMTKRPAPEKISEPFEDERAAPPEGAPPSDENGESPEAVSEDGSEISR